MTTATATITQAFERYVDTFQSLDRKATRRVREVRRDDWRIIVAVVCDVDGVLRAAGPNRLE